MRLQSIPDNFVIVNATQEARNTLIGNAVPALLGQAVGWTLLRAMRRVDVFEPQQRSLFER